MTEMQREMAIQLALVWAVCGFKDDWTWQEIDDSDDINVWTKATYGRHKWTIASDGKIKGNYELVGN